MYWVHLVVEKRLLVGAFYTSFQDLLEHEQTFLNYFRLYIASFHELNDKSKDILQRHDAVMRHWTYADGSSSNKVSETFLL